MKLTDKIGNFDTIFEKPSKWARSVVGSKLRITFIISFHIIAMMITCFFVAVAVGFDGGRQFLVKTLPLFGTLVLLANLNSVLYIYILYRLINRSDQANIQNNNLN